MPDVPVFLLAGAQCRSRCAAAIAARPWIRVVPLDPGGVIEACATLRSAHGLSRISVVGGRRTASSFVDAGAIRDLCLTTTSLDAGEPRTPFYSGTRPPALEVIVRKEGTADGLPLLFEHLALVTPAPRSTPP